MSSRQEFETKLRTLYAEEHCRFGEPMEKHTTFRVGGPAEYYVIPNRVEQLQETLALCKEYDVPCVVIGNGSNLLVADAGVEGVVIRLEDKKATPIYEEGADGVTVTVPAGMLLSTFAREVSAKGYTGLEYATGIPGTVGGGVVMNAGAYGGEIKDNLTRVTVLNEVGAALCVPATDLELGYRHSAVDEKRYIVLNATFVLHRGDKESIAERVAEYTRARKEKQPLEYPSAGSTFKRPEGYFAGKLIDDCGLRGYVHGGAQVSEKHCGFLINRGDATATEIKQLIAYVQKCVNDKFGVCLETEVRFLGDFTK